MLLRNGKYYDYDTHEVLFKHQVLIEVEIIKETKQYALAFDGNYYIIEKPTCYDDYGEFNYSYTFLTKNYGNELTCYNKATELFNKLTKNQTVRYPYMDLLDL